MGHGDKQKSDKTSASPSGWAVLSRPLQESGEIAAMRLASGLSEALKLSANQLFSQSTQAFTPLERESFLDAADFARMRRQSLVEDFRRYFEQGYIQACLREPVPSPGHVIDFDATNLQIIEHDLLEDVLDPLMITEAIKNGSRRTAQTLSKWFRGWLNAPELDPNDLPLGPKLIGGAVSGAVKGQLWRHEAKHRLMLVLCRHLPGQVNLLYRDLSDYLDALYPMSFMREAEATDSSVLPGKILQDAVPSFDTATVVAEASADTTAAVDGETGVEALKAAGAAVRGSMAGQRLPEAIDQFLTGQWQALLALIHGDQGKDSPEWADAVQAMDTLIRTLTFESTDVDREALVRGLPDLMISLHQGLERLGTPTQVRNWVFIVLTECRAKLVAVSRKQVLAEKAASEARAASSPTDTETGNAIPGNTGIIPPAHQSTPAARGPQAGETLLEGIKTGNWLEVMQADGGKMNLKVAWISTHRGLFLLTNRHGARALSLGAQNLSELLQSGQARVIPAPDKTDISDQSDSGRPSKKTA